MLLSWRIAKVVPEVPNMLFSDTSDLNPYQQIGMQLSYIKTREGVTLKDMAEIAECDRRTVRRWIKGKGAPDIVQASKLSQAFDWNFMFGSQVVMPPVKEPKQDNTF